jgi:hypothetical protein
MKYMYLTIILAAAMIGQAQARIGYTLEQCRAAYGKEVKTEVAWTSPDQTAYGFISDDLYIYAIFSAGGKVVDIIYFDNTDKKDLPADVIAKLWDENVDRGRVWDDEFYRSIVLNTGWNGKRLYKKLGQEPFKHWIMFESNGPSALVENAKGLGWQIRTFEQFKLEQKAIRELAAKKAHAATGVQS